MSIYIAGINFMVRFDLRDVASQVVFYGMVCFGAGVLCAGRDTDRVLCFSWRMVPSYPIMPFHTARFNFLHFWLICLAC